MSVLLALFSALGAVLLFLLKLVGILLLIGMVLLALVLFCPFCADVQWEQGVFTVKAGALGLAFPVFQYPKPQPTEPEEPKGPLGKLKAKFRAWRAERKAKKAAAKAEKPAKPKKETSPRKKAKLTLNIICTMLRGARAADPGDLRDAAVYQNPHLPWCPGRRPRAGGPHLWQAERLALHLAGCSGSLSLPGF